MRIRISRAASEDLLKGHEFYERQQQGIGGYFLDSLYADIDALLLYGGTHPKPIGRLHRAMARRFPFAIYYDLKDDLVTGSRGAGLPAEPEFHCGKIAETVNLKPLSQFEHGPFSCAPVLYYSQLMTLAYGGSAKEAGLPGNVIKARKLEEFAGFLPHLESEAMAVRDPVRKQLQRIPGQHVVVTVPWTAGGFFVIGRTCPERARQ